MTAPMTIVFDLDGTLAHTSPDIHAALNAALSHYGKEVSLTDTERMIGGGLRTLLDRSFEQTGLSLSEEEVNATLERLLAYYRAHPADKSILYGWITETMAGLHREGARIAICSNKSEDLVLQILDLWDVARWIHAAVGHVDGRKKKPDPEPLLLSIAGAGGDVSRAVMVGDSGADVGAARAIGVPVILVPHGYGSQDIRELDADRIVSSASELKATISELLGADAASI